MYDEPTRKRRAEAARKWREANKDRVIAYRAAYCEANRERISEYNKTHRTPAQRRVLWNKYSASHRVELNEKCRAFRLENREHCLKLRRENYAKHRQRERDRLRQWKLSNPEKIGGWEKKNTEKVRLTKRIAQNARRASQLTASPKWLTHTQQIEIKSIYAEAARVKLVVDHIIPLKSRIVCGLHVPWNLQLLSKSDNSIKSNKVTQ